MVEADGRKEFKTEDTFDEISAAQQLEFLFAFAAQKVWRYKKSTIYLDSMACTRSTYIKLLEPKKIWFKGVTMPAFCFRQILTKM